MDRISVILVVLYIYAMPKGIGVMWYRLFYKYAMPNGIGLSEQAKFLSKFGGRLQFSVFEIRNSERALDNIMTHITAHFEKKFSQTDSVIIFDLSKQCKITKYGYAKNDDGDLLIIG